MTTTTAAAPAPALPGATSGTSSPAAPARRPRWEVPAFVGLLVATAALYLVGLSASGYGNSFYAAAAQAGSRSWWAYLWGASDAGASITVDKPPASLWVMGLSVRIFGLSSWSVLAPQALMGVATVALAYRTVRRHFSAGAALLAGAALALTPVAALMFRFDNPDALLVLLLVAAVWATLRAVDGPATTRWMALAGVFVGLAFLTKQLQAFLVLPGLAVAYLWAAPVSWPKRIRDGLVAVATMVVSAGWWVALVELWPSGSRPYVGGSQNDSFLELTFGYNGFGRLTGDEVGSVGGGGGRAGGWGETGLARMFSTDMGGQIAWLIPAALVLAVAALWALRRAGRTSGARAQVVAWLGWLLVTGLTFSYMAGIFHAYYTVALAPAVAALVGIGADLAWQRRAAWGWRALLAAVTLATGWWSWVLLSRSADWYGWLRWAVLGASVLGAALLALGAVGAASRRRMLAAGAAAAVLAGLAGPAAYTLQTVSTAHTGSIVSAGPTVSGASGGFGGRGGQGGPGGGFGGGTTGQGTTNGQGAVNGQGATNGQGTPGQGRGASGGRGTGTTNGGAPGGTGIPGGTSTGRGGTGGLLSGTSVSSELAALIEQDAASYRWAAATTGSQNAASYQLATQASVMPIGGFNGSDPSPTLEQFQAWVAAGEIHWYVAGDGLGRSNGGSDTAAQIAEWVEATFTATTVDGTTLYDLSASA
jgi:4-amino-4-deoxy-L-arabinose transferase-like glycosyltransferase